jgi:uncharacterized protein (TIGR03435 family)
MKANLSKALMSRPVDSRGPSIRAIQEQIGQKLESEKGPARILVVEHVE